MFSVNITAQNADKHFLIVGTYTSGPSEGIYVFSFDTKTGIATKTGSVYSSNPSYITVSPDKKFLFAVNEDDPGYVSSFSFNKSTGALTLVNKQPSNGAHPCYITIDKSGKWILTGNYSGGNFSLIPVNKKGELGTPKQTIEHEGSSVDEARQEKPHVHATVLSPDNKFLFVPDLGIDKLMIYAFDGKKGTLKPAQAPYEMTEPGSGPRHFDFHPNGKYAYLMEELSGSISVYAYDKNGRLSLLQNHSALPHDYLGPIGSADIHVSPDGKFLYSSNRGESNTIAVFAIKKDGKIWPVSHQATMGKKPRNFNFDPSGNFLLVANQDSNEIVVFKRDKESGLLSDTGRRISVPSPVCIKWVSY